MNILMHVELPTKCYWGYYLQIVVGGYYLPTVVGGYYLQTVVTHGFNIRNAYITYIFFLVKNSWVMLIYLQIFAVTYRFLL